jgi:hypothetical protein
VRDQVVQGVFRFNVVNLICELELEKGAEGDGTEVPQTVADEMARPTAYCFGVKQVTINPFSIRISR